MVHNEYAAVSGEEVQMDHIAASFRAHDHTVTRYTRSSSEITQTRFGKTKAFFTGVFSPRARGDLRALLNSSRYDLAFIGNLFPLISPSALPVIARSGTPVVMRVPNYRFMCPNGLFYSHGEICERCSGGREYWCILRNCEGSLAKSIGYALRNWTARVFDLYRKNVSAFICASQFMRRKLVAAGFSAAKVHVVPNVAPLPANTDSACPRKSGSFVGYAGRISPEKGVNTLVRAAMLCPDIPFRLAGRIRDSALEATPLPKNVEFVGFLRGMELGDFYADAGMLVFPSECYETFGMTVAEALLRRCPVIVSRIGVLPELVEDGFSGLFFEPGNATDLADKIRFLWNSPATRLRMGAHGQKTAKREYSRTAYCDRLMAACRRITPRPYVRQGLIH